MRICILGETPSAAGRLLTNTGYTNLKAGMLLQARVVAVSDSGHPVFQFDGFRAMAEKPMGGQVGDIWHFEVAQDAGTQNGQQPSNRPSANLVQTPQGSPNPDGLTQSGKPLQLIPLLAGRQSTIASSKTPPPPLPPTASPTAAMAVAAPSLGSVMAQPEQILSTWFQQIRHMAVPRTGRQGTKTDVKTRGPHRWFREQKLPRPPDRPELAEPKKSDRCGEVWNCILSSGFRLERQPVRMKLYRHASGMSGEENTFLTATFLLNLDDSGAVRVDIKLGAENMYITISVEDEALRRQYAEALPLLSNALTSLTKHCYCRVDMDTLLIQEISKEEEMVQEKLRLDIRA